jgi:hypothetical protein
MSKEVCNKELATLYNKEKANPGSVNKKDLLAKYLECANYKEVHVISSNENEIEIEMTQANNMFSNQDGDAN